MPSKQIYRDRAIMLRHDSFLYGKYNRGRKRLLAHEVKNLLKERGLPAPNVKEIDLNPVALYPKGSVILDAKMEII